MCGIVGIITKERALEKVRAMSASITYRGPDDEGHWTCDTAGIGLGHRRLSIVDLSPAGRQPMESACRRYIMTFNGEIYNFAEIKGRLEREDSALSKQWKGTSDTEVALAAISRWGVMRSLESFAGMFAFALWDRKEQVLYLARDRIGEKPLYYGEIAGSFIFGSELKAIAAVGHQNMRINRSAIASLMEFGYVANPMSIYEGVSKLPPGTVLKVVVRSPGKYNFSGPESYWSLNRPDLEDVRREFEQSSDDHLVQRLHDILLKTVQQEMVADVGVGAFLSGGIDSSLVVALMQATSSANVRTFTIGFDDRRFDEAPYAKAVAKHLNTSHTEMYLSPRDAYELIPSLSTIYDEPLGDSSQIPTVLISKLTRKHVTVALSGDGGDELFAGYPRYQFGPSLWRKISPTPKLLRHAFSAGLRFVAPNQWDHFLNLLPEKIRPGITGHRLHRLAQLLSSSDFDKFYASLVAQWQEPNRLVLGGTSCSPLPQLNDPVLVNKMRAFDIKRYLPDDILAKVDRASMSASLETRAPLLHHDVVEFAWALPQRALFRGGDGKWILRKVLERYVPKSLFERPKSGFSIPLAAWLRHELRDWAEDLLDERALREQGFLDPQPVRQLWTEHLSGKFDRQAYLWNVLVFQGWLRHAQQAQQTTEFINQ